MNIRTLLLPLALLPTALMPPGAQASAHDIVIGIDEKAVWGPDGIPVNGPPGHDALAVMDVTDPLHPTIRATLPVENSVFGPPTNLQITPDGRLALLADSVSNVQGADGKWTAAPGDKVFAIDLDASRRPWWAP